MSVYDNLKLLIYVFAIGAVYMGMTFLYDNITTVFNQLTTTGLVSQLTVQVQQVIYYGIAVYALITLLLVCIGTILIANARSNMQTVYSMSPWGFISCFISIIISLIFNTVLASLDLMIIPLLTVTSPAFTMFNVEWIMRSAYNVAHLIPVLILLSGYFFLVLNTLRVETVEAAYGGYE